MGLLDDHELEELDFAIDPNHRSGTVFHELNLMIGFNFASSIVANEHLSFNFIGSCNS